MALTLDIGLTRSLTSSSDTMSKSVNGLLISDFNIENFAAYLRNDPAEPRLECEAAPFGQITQSLLDDSLPFWKNAPGFVVVWSRPESVLESFARALAGLPVDPAALRQEVDDFCHQLKLAKDRTRIVFVPTWVVPAMHSGHGLLDLAKDVGVTRLLLQANLRLLENLDGLPNVVPLNTARWVELAGEKAFNPRLWYLGKVPFGNELFKAAVRDLKSGLRGWQGRSRKLVVLDLDDTLWGGIVGDVGWQNVVLGGHDATGEALVDFQRELQGLTRRGIVLAIASKNEESVALEAIRQHPEMVLKLDDFAAWRINWQDKAQNILELLAELNLGIESVVFIDDNPVERARVREALPDVLVPEWPEDKRLYPHALRSLDCFDKPSISDEDRQRPQMYATERRRTELKSQAGSVEDWLQTLDLRVGLEPLQPANVARLTQLLNKTNQLNLSTRRLTEAEFLAWAEPKHRRVWGFHVADKFGDSGLTGILSLESTERTGRIVDFILSCRVMGRKVEETLIHVAVEWARAAGLTELQATYLPTPKNKPCYDFFKRSGLEQAQENLFRWDTRQEYRLPAVIRLLSEEK